MLTSNGDSNAPQWFILFGGWFFVLVLGISADGEAEIPLVPTSFRFQARMYIATIVLKFSPQSQSPRGYQISS